MPRDVIDHLILGNETFEIVDKAARSLIVPTHLTASANLNNLKQAGTYLFAKVGNTFPSNQPDEAYQGSAAKYPSFRLNVWIDSEAVIHQMYIDTRDGLIALRMYDEADEQWTDWHVFESKSMWKTLAITDLAPDLHGKVELHEGQAIIRNGILYCSGIFGTLQSCDANDRLLDIISIDPNVEVSFVASTAEHSTFILAIDGSGIKTCQTISDSETIYFNVAVPLPINTYQ